MCMVLTLHFCDEVLLVTGYIGLLQNRPTEYRPLIGGHICRIKLLQSQ